ncbi:hypothetical protein QR77_03455 [Streptomyces sp. 150FB]|uniref:ATP-binding protein n=1 Tax=Streptomyces sp. 150FB TaxID=1576605 RepID=UPI0005895FD5|nr:ATP-binding protein [Streptomyces sp. 150FB]KIF73277.1 hypothetical protein QR77_03455 [Streptomyces sp. 150FB]
MPENNGAPEAVERIRTGDVSGTMVVGHHNTVNNLTINTGSGSTFKLHTGPLPDPVKRQPISHLPRSAVEPLIGRARDLRFLQEAIGTHQLVQVWGAPGVGKSALLRHLACTMAPGHDGAAYVEAGGRTADDIAQAIFDISFDAPNYKPSLEVLKERLKTLRLRIYLDDAGLDEKDLRRLFDMAEQSTFVFTSQQRSAVDGVHAIQLAGLTASAAAELVAALLSRGLRPDEVPVVDALRDAVDGNPLRLRRIAMAAATGKGLPGIADLPELLPALLNKLRPQERDLLYLLGSLSGAELAARHLNDLLRLPDSGALADGLVRHGLLVSSETGYACPPDVAECVLNTRKTEFPADRLCQAFTVWVEAKDTAPDDVAAHFQALDVAVLRAERSGHARLGAALARAASPKLALSRQFDAWGSLLGVGWAAARSAGDTEGEEFFLNEARTRRRAIGRAAQTTALALEAEVLWHELTAPHAHSTAHQVAGAASTTAPPIATPPVHPVTPTHGAVHTQAITHPTVSTSATSAPAHTPLMAHAARPVVDLSHTAAQPHVVVNAAGAHSAAPIPQRIDLSAAHSSVAPSTHAASTTTTTASTGHTGVAAVGATGFKTGVSGLVLACSLGLAAVLGVGAIVSTNDQPTSSSVVVPSPVITSSLSDDTAPADDTLPADDTSPSVDPLCATVLPQLTSEAQQYDIDADAVDAAFDSYNSAVGDYNTGATSTVPDGSTVVSSAKTVVTDLNATASTLQQAISEAQDSSVEADLNNMLTATQDLASQYEAIGPDVSGAVLETSSQSSAMQSAVEGLLTDCGA